MFQLFLATPEKKIVTDAELEEITVPGYAGELNILPGHAPLMTTLEPGILKYKLKSGQHEELAIGWGYCQVSATGVNVLVEEALTAMDIDTQKVDTAISALENRIGTDTLSEAEWDKVQKQIATLRAQKELVH